MGEKLELALITAAEGELTSLPPLGTACVAAALRRGAPGVEPRLETRLEELLRGRPGMAGISATTDNYALAARWARRIKAELGVPVILGGAHISLAPGSLDPVFDAAVIGEGEVTAAELLRSYLRRGRFDHGELAEVPGLAFYSGGALRLTAPRPPAADLAALPRPYAELGRGGAVRHVFSARGCPYDCDFCSSSRLFPGYRSLSAADLAADIERLVSEGAGRIIFYDDLFIADRRRLAALAGELERRGLAGRCRYTGSVRADLVDDETCALMERIGLDFAAVGLESFSDGVLRSLNKTGLTGARNLRALELLAARGIAALGLLMFGAPGETAADADLTLGTVYRCVGKGLLRDVYWSMLTPYPGTRTWERAEARGLVGMDMDWGLFSGGGQGIYLGGLPRGELELLLAEWRAKLTLLRPDHGSASRTSLFFTDGAELDRAMEAVSKGRKDWGKRAGDDLLLAALKARGRPAL